VLGCDHKRNRVQTYTNVIDETPEDFAIIASIVSIICVNDATASWCWNGESDAEISGIDHFNGKLAT
jgi:hypothetical protein